MVFNYHDMVVALKAALHYTPVSILISIVPMFVGLLCGTLIALVRIYRIRFLAKGCQIFVTICKGIPLILVLLIFRYVFSMGFEAYVAAAMVYWAVCILIERFSMHLEKKLRAHIRVGLM